MDKKIVSPGWYNEHIMNVFVFVCVHAYMHVCIMCVCVCLFIKYYEDNHHKTPFVWATSLHVYMFFMVLTNKSLLNKHLPYSQASDEISSMSPDFTAFCGISVCVHYDGVYLNVCGCEYGWVRVCSCVCVHACVHVCVCVWMPKGNLPAKSSS